MESLDALRLLVQQHMTEHDESYVAAASQLGVSDGALHQFLKSTNRGISVEMCLRIAHYLGVSNAVVLRMAGHGEIAALLLDLDAGDDDIYLQELGKSMTGLDPDQKVAIVQNARAMAKIFKARAKPYNIIGGEDDKPKKRDR